MGHCLSGTPAFTHTKTFFNVPLPLITTSSDFWGDPAWARAQAGVADMSIVRIMGLSPEKLTLPVSVAAVASSTTAGAVECAADSSLGGALSLLPPQATRNRAEIVAKLIRIFFIATEFSSFEKR